MTAVWPAIALLSLTGTILWTTGPAGVFYAAVYAIVVVPGIPVGRAVFGRHHAAGWVLGSLLGYGTTQLALWAAIAIGHPTGLTFLGCWGIQAAVLLWIGRRVRTPSPLPEYTRADVRALCLVLLLVPVLMGPPYRNIGTVDAGGTRYYRAYFTADFVWHTALAAEVGKHAMPPKNPYLAPDTIHYYWTYFLLPSIVAHDGPALLRDVQRTLKVNAICSATLVVAALFVLVRTAVPAAWAAVVAVILGVVAASAEGTWVLLETIAAHRPLATVTDVNVDAFTNWRFGGLRIDCMPRSLWYNPQHSIACALGMSALVVASASAVSRAAVLFAATALALATCMNPFVGAVFAGIYGLAVIWQAVAERRLLNGAMNLAPAVLGVAGALAWCSWNQIASGASTSLHFGLIGLARHRPVATLFASAGPMLIPAAFGLWPDSRDGLAGRRTALVGTVTSLLLLFFVMLGDDAWVGFRAGQILLLMLPVLVAAALWRLSRLRHGRLAVTLVVALVAVAGLPTTIIDEFNAQDIHNSHMGAGFRWTVTLSAAQQEGLDWIKRYTPQTAIVQMEPEVRGRDEWSLIPSFAERRMAAGLPISLLAVREYRDRSNEVRRMFETDDAGDAARIAHHWHIRFIYVDETDRAAYPAGVRKFDSAPGLFEPVFRNGEVGIYRVH